MMKEQPPGATDLPWPLIPRHLTPLLTRSAKSVLLLGPRQTGKSTLVQGLAPDLTINLMREAEFLEFARNPRELEQRLAASRPTTVFIDEVQRLPSLLNTIQAILDEQPGRHRFYLTGSSARKLRRGQANLLPGRIHSYELGPLVLGELAAWPGGLDTRTALAYGTLPGILCDPDERERRRTLTSYAATYVREEVQAEALSRNLEGFSRFLYVAAATCTRFLDLAKLSREAAISRASAVRFFEILEDTLLVRRVEPFGRGLGRRLVGHPRFYFFDNGVLNGLLGSFELSADRLGPLFENLLVGQIMHSVAAAGETARISTYRTAHGAEVDLILEHNGELLAIEAKAAENVGPADLKGLASFTEVCGRPHRSYIATLGGARRRIGEVEVVPWQQLVAELMERCWPTG